jgi:anti-sigma factor RsiW
MNCHQARRLFSLYYDSEGDAGLQLEIGDHVAVCPECQDWFSRQSHGEDALVHLLSTGDATPATWEAIEGRVRASARPRPRSVRFRFWRVARALLAMAAALLVAVVLRQWPWAPESGTDLSQLAAAEHERYLDGRWKVEVQSESVDDVEQALRPRAGFAVRCPPKGQAGFHLRGGGLCQLGRETGVHIVGDVQTRPVSVIVLPGDALRSFPHMREHLVTEKKPHRCREGRYEMVASLLHGHVVVVLGEISPDVLVEILQGYGSHHASNTADKPFLAALR